jgi:hypothetical protein
MEPTSAMLCLTLGDRDWAAPAIVAVAVRPEGGAGVVVGEGAEVVEPGGGLGAFEAVTDILLVLIAGLDVSGDAVLLPVEVGEYLALLGVVVDVGAQSPVSHVDGGVDDGFGMGGLVVEEVEEPGGECSEGAAIGVARGGVDGAQVLFVVVGGPHGSDDVGWVAGTPAEEGGHVEASSSVRDGEIGGDVVVGDVAIGGVVSWRGVVCFLFEASDCFLVQLGLVGEVLLVAVGGVGKGDCNLEDLSHQDVGVGEGRESGAWREDVGKWLANGFRDVARFRGIGRFLADVRLGGVDVEVLVLNDDHVVREGRECRELLGCDLVHDFVRDEGVLDLKLLEGLSSFWGKVGPFEEGLSGLDEGDDGAIDGGSGHC